MAFFTMDSHCYECDATRLKDEGHLLLTRLLSVAKSRQMNLKHWGQVCVLLLAFLLLKAEGRAETFRIMTFNVESYLDAPTETRRVKSPDSRAKVVESILAGQPDVLALQEMGTTNALMELRASLKAKGLDLPFWEHVNGSDTNIHVAVLSRFEFTNRKAHTNGAYLLSGRRFRVNRGFSEVEVQVNPRYRFTLLVCHLKSRMISPLADENEMREEEARLLAEIVRARMQDNPQLNLAVVGDFNDGKDSKTVRTLLGRGKMGLFDTRPAEKGTLPSTGEGARSACWTYFYGKSDEYSRIDYILISAGMKREWLPDQSYIVNLPDWGLASDHRPVVCSFETDER